MRTNAVWAAAAITVCDFVGLAQDGAPAPAAASRVVVLEQAPKDRSIAISQAKLAQYQRDMDAKKLETLRLIEGGKYNVNIRRITKAEPALVHPITADLWVVLEGQGTLTTGGVLKKGRISGGRTRPIEAGDVVYIPSGLPHGVSRVDRGITWLNMRWDTDWLPGSPMGAGTLADLIGAAAESRAASADGGAGSASGGARDATPGAALALAKPPGPALPRGSQQRLPYHYGGSAELYFSRETLAEIMAGMKLTKASDTRLIEGGHYSVDLHWSAAPSTVRHPQTIETRYVLAGGGAVAGEGTTGNVEGARDAARVPVAPARGDVFFYPSSIEHGFEVSPDAFSLDVRWDDNYERP